jgi:1A family penicillin-binding protein
MPDEDPRERIKRLLDSEDDTHAEKPSQPARNTDPFLSRPALDKDNMPLPHRINEIDMDGTRVTLAAYEPTTSGHRAGTTRNAVPHNVHNNKKRRLSFRNLRKRLGCFSYGLIISLFTVVLLLLCGGSFALYEYYSIASTLPDIGGLKDSASQFETTHIMDRNGNLLYEILDPNAGRRTYIPLDAISPNLIAATIATEDKEFYNHPGFDPLGIVRALWQNYTSGETVSGASTITQQLARALLLSAEERAQRTYTRKAREIILAAEITRRYSKDEILELYLNEIYYGNLAYGVEAAAETYFGKPADHLTLAEASFLAGLPQSPAIYDIYTNPEDTLIRQQQVLVLMFGLSNEQGCIHVSNSETPVCVDAISATNAANEMKSYSFRAQSFDARYPHWVNFIRAELEKKYDAQTIYRSGFTVYTTLDPVMQDQAQQLVTQQVAGLADKQAFNGALVAIKPSTGEILAMVGSADFNNAGIAGQINMAVSQTRQPGSSIKPINYVAAFEKGWTPSTLIWDVPSEFPPSGDPNDTREPYKPSNYDGKFHGPVTVRVALANSFNVPAVKTLNFIGVYDNPNTPEKDGMIAMAERLGITSLTAPDYGLSLTLGGGEVSLLEMTSAFSVFANEGKRIPPVAILKITDYAGEVVDEYKPETAEQVIRPEHAYLISSILSDNNARSWMFGPNSVLNLPFQAAVKTGTSGTPKGDAQELVFDNWTIGYTPDLATGVWIGNADYKPMINTAGSTGAAPIWSQFMQYAVPYLTNNNPTPFKRPEGITDKIVCALSGTEPSNWCKQQYSEIFAFDQLPSPPGQDLVRNIKLDIWTGLEASDKCKEFTEEETVLNITDPWARKWLDSNDGRKWLDSHDLPGNPIYAPERECTASDPHPVIEFELKEGQVITQPSLEIKGSAYANEGFRRWSLDYGQGAEPTQWTTLDDSKRPVESETLYAWDLTGIPNGPLTLRLTLMGDHGDVQRLLHLTLELPAPTRPPTLTPTLTPIPPSPTPTETPTLTPIPPTETPTEPLTETPTVTEFPTP